MTGWGVSKVETRPWPGLDLTPGPLESSALCVDTVSLLTGFLGQFEEEVTLFKNSKTNLSSTCRIG